MLISALVVQDYIRQSDSNRSVSIKVTPCTSLDTPSVIRGCEGAARPYWPCCGKMGIEYAPSTPKPQNSNSFLGPLAPLLLVLCADAGVRCRHQHWNLHPSHHTQVCLGHRRIPLPAADPPPRPRGAPQKTRSSPHVSGVPKSAGIQLKEPQICNCHGFFQRRVPGETL